MDTQVRQEFGTLVPVLGADGRCFGQLIRGRGGDIGSHRRPRPVLTAKATDYRTLSGGGLSLRVGQRGARPIERRPAVPLPGRMVVPFKVADPRLSPQCTIQPSSRPGCAPAIWQGSGGRRLRLWPLEQRHRQLGDVCRYPPRLVAGEEMRNPGRFLRYIKVTAKERCSQMLRLATGFAEP
jgi:hypothetical protein